LPWARHLPTLKCHEQGGDLATFVSAENECRYCQTIHGAIAAHHLGGNEDLVVQVKNDPQRAAISDKLKALLVIAGKTAESGKLVTAADVERARQHGATDVEIHDTVLIASRFCMANRYVDGLATFTPEDDKVYDRMGAMMANKGYSMPGKVELFLMSVFMRFKGDRNGARSRPAANAQ